ncbi:MAG: carbohydrate binding family 9 domain-containing protein [Longimicrobiales bacterium]|nr:carbohydrate binding family 9 domain-containing protein [Longimicrobiales bacterium]
MKTTPVLTLSVALFFFLSPGVLSSQQPATSGGTPGPRETLVPLRTEIPPVIDGRLDEALWREAPFVTDFRTWTPDFGQTMVGETRAYMAYDGTNLYFAFRALDPDPGNIKASITERDNIRRDDWVAINLDTFNDQQALYAFYVNPLGIQGDTRLAGGQEDPNADLVWYSGGRIDETGYTVEIQIPLKSVRFTHGDTVTMGVIFERQISREREAGTYPPLDPAQGESWLTQMTPMVYQGLERERVVELLPAYTYLKRQAVGVDGGRLETEEEQGDLSLTGKYGITSDLIFDGTYNPDFSQVEADASQVDVNLRYQLFVPEKRAFFREGGEHFAVAATGASLLDPVNSIVYTRTIVDPIAGAKLTGKVGAKDFVASIYSVDELETEPGSGDPEYAHIPILRYKRALDEDSYLGGIYSGREVGSHYNRVGGVDGQLRLTGASTLAYHGILSQTKEDSASASESGRALGVHFLHSTRDLDISLVAKDVSENFKTETGFVWRTGILQVSGQIRPKFYPDSEIFRRVDLELFSGQTKDRFSDQWETFNQALVHAYVLSNLSLRAAYSYGTEIFQDHKFDIGGLTLAGSGQITTNFFASVSFRKSKAIRYSLEPYQGESTRATASVTYQPSDKVRSDLNYTHVDFHRESDGEEIYDYPIYWGRLTYQLNRYLFLRGILEYNEYRKEMLTDFLASFTYIPGTVVHVGYGSLRDKVRYEQGSPMDSDDFLEVKRSFFFKMSYLWRR